MPNPQVNYNCLDMVIIFESSFSRKPACDFTLIQVEYSCRMWSACPLPLGSLKTWIREKWMDTIVLYQYKNEHSGQYS